MTIGGERQLGTSPYTLYCASRLLRRYCFSSLLQLRLNSSHTLVGLPRSSSPPPTSSKSSVRSTKTSQTPCLLRPTPLKRRYATPNGKRQTSLKLFEKAVNPHQDPLSPSPRSPYLLNPRLSVSRPSHAQHLPRLPLSICQALRAMSSFNNNCRPMFQTNFSHIPCLEGHPSCKARHGVQLLHQEPRGYLSTQRYRGPLLERLGSAANWREDPMDLLPPSTSCRLGMRPCSPHP